MAKVTNPNCYVADDGALYVKVIPPSRLNSGMDIKVNGVRASGTGTHVKMLLLFGSIAMPR